MKKVIIIGLILIFMIFIIYSYYKISYDNTLKKEGVKSTITSSKLINLYNNQSKSQGMIAWDSECSDNPNCIYVLNPPGRNTPSCININHVSDNENLIIDEDYNCKCRPLISIYNLPEQNTNVWFEDEGSLVCQPVGIEILNLTLSPSIIHISEPFTLRETIKNLGNITCESMITFVDYGNGQGLTVFVDFAKPYFEPNTESYLDLPMRYDQSGIYNLHITNVCNSIFSGATKQTFINVI
jgi:hypothetical protein